ncbi:hypothetical protein EHS13_34145 [Paenibacillus psychroresistens]|uniref:Phospholipase C/D domain-containing protein n=1 Tax=Paenibacillus psychroresistens TaxID=1778678 RepID=A0A6B8RWI0_9BACL|nr:zinc dependent phospholipase C family protein [Paenibacillus psychroresistens]QGQ99546.1 hypothetical protein EHS13_34145 [Paenibacillus psychroresistens]
MPWQMVHFAIADKLYKDKPSSAFLLGSIAPDAIHSRENSNRQDKNRTHLCKKDGSMPDLESLANFCITNLNKFEDLDWNSFVLGYASHVLADLRWTETIWEEYKEKIKQSEDRNEPIKKIYSMEVCQLDFELYKEEWAGYIFASLADSKVFSIEPYLTDTEISLYRDKTISWLKDPANEPQITLRYITEDAVKEFIKTTSDELSMLIKDWTKLSKKSHA